MSDYPKITKNEDATKFSIEVKRFYIPYTIEDQCPRCGELIKKDLTSEYLSYPVLGAPERVGFYHEAETNGKWEEHEWEVTVVLSLDIKLT